MLVLYLIISFYNLFFNSAFNNKRTIFLKNVTAAPMSQCVVAPAHTSALPFSTDTNPTQSSRSGQSSNLLQNLPSTPSGLLFHKFFNL